MKELLRKITGKSIEEASKIIMLNFRVGRERLSQMSRAFEDGNYTDSYIYYKDSNNWVCATINEQVNEDERVYISHYFSVCENSEITTEMEL